MKPGGKKRRRWRIVRRLIFVCLIGVLVVWGTANLFFSISWGTGLLASKIEKRVGLPCELESMTWTPWGGLVIRDLVFKPEKDSGFGGEILRVDQISVDPSWTSLIQRKKRFERLEISGVKGGVSIEFLKTLLKSETPITVREEQEESAPSSEASSPKETAGQTPDAGKVQQTPPEKKTAPPVQIQPVDDFEGTVVFREVNLALTSERFPDLSVAVESLEGELPVWGGEREGKLKFESLRIGREIVNGKDEISARWKDGFLRIDDHAIKLAGLTMKLDVAMRMVGGLPLGIQIEAPTQRVDFSPFFREKKSPMSIEKFAIKGRLQGFLTMPSSFSGYGSAGFENLNIRDEKDGSSIEFYRGFGEAKVSRAGVIIPQARMIGDDEAILLNGFVSSGGEAAAVVRLVGSPERAETYEKRVRRAQENWTLGFAPLVTEDRLYRDLRLESSQDGLTVDLGESRKPVPLLSAIKAILGGQSQSESLLQ